MKRKYCSYFFLSFFSESSIAYIYNACRKEKISD